jgi:hypothetical protein
VSELGIDFPAVELKQRIMIGTEPRGPALPGEGWVEHAAERWPVDGDRLHTKANDPPGEPIHQDQDPVTAEQDRFGPAEGSRPE